MTNPNGLLLVYAVQRVWVLMNLGSSQYSSEREVTDCSHCRQKILEYFDYLNLYKHYIVKTLIKIL